MIPDNPKAPANYCWQGQGQGWRWRELNPRPQEANQTFSGRSRLIVLLGSCTHVGMSQTSPVTVESRMIPETQIIQQSLLD